MRALITGGTGFIGKHLTEKLLKKGWEVVILSRRPAVGKAVEDNGTTLVGWDGRTAGGWGEYAEGADAMVNLAGAGIADGKWTERRKAIIRDSRVNAGKAVTEALLNAKDTPKALIQASAVGWYGMRGSEILDETSESGNGFLAETAREWENSTQAVERAGVRRVIIRTGVVLGGRGGALEKMALPFRLFVGGPVGTGRQWMSWIHIEDEVNAIIHLIENHELSGVFNLTAPEPVTNKEFSKELGKALGRPSWLPVPGLALKLLMGRMADELLLNGQRVLPRGLETGNYEFKYPTITKALQETVQKS